VRSIALMADVVCEQLTDAGIGPVGIVRAPFEHLCRGLADTNVRAR